MTEAFTFRDEVVSKYDLELYDLFMDVFDSLPLAAVVANKYLAMHGGISPDLTHVDEINDINRFAEVPLSGAFCDLLWSDPMDDTEAAKGQFTKNEARDCSHYFGKHAAAYRAGNGATNQVVAPALQHVKYALLCFEYRLARGAAPK